MNYQDFESAWYLGLIITSFFCVMLTGVVVVLRHARRLAEIAEYEKSGELPPLPPG